MSRYYLLQSLLVIRSANRLLSNIGLLSQSLSYIDVHTYYFYMLGSMGLSSSIGLGLSIAQEKQVISIDGDGSVLMNMNTLSTIGNRAPVNYTLLIIDNGSLGSTVDQPKITTENTSITAEARGEGGKKRIEDHGEETGDK